MPRRLIVLAIAAAGSLALVAWFALKGSSGSRSDVAAPAPGEPVSAARSGTEPASLAAPAAAARPAEEDAEPPDARTAAKRSSAYEDELARGHWVEGRVVFPPGTPADEKAVVRASGFDFEHGPDHSVEVGPDGSFRVAFSERTRRGKLELDARYLYLEDAVGVDLRAEAAPVTLEPRLGGRIEGTLVLAEGNSAESLESARVLLSRSVPSGGMVWQRDYKRVDPEGLAFSFSGLAPSDRYRLALGSEQAYCRDADVTVESGKAVSIALEVHAGVTVEGRVVDQEGAPLSDALILVRSRDRATDIETFRNPSSGADGTFRARGVAPGAIGLETTSPGFRSNIRRVTGLRDGEVVSGIEIVLERGLAISGRVSWPDGTPADAFVQATAEGPHNGIPESAPAQANDEGAFTISGLSEGIYIVLARGVRTDEVQETSPITGKPRTRKKLATWNATQEHVAGGTDGLELVLDPGSVLTGSVVDDRGAPIESFTISVHPVGGGEVIQRSVHDEAGRFELAGIARNAWTLRAEAAGHVDAEQDIRVPDELGPFELVLARTGRLAGVVLDPDGRPVEGASVSWSHQQRPGYYVGSGPAATSDGSGRFLVENVAPGVVQLNGASDRASRSEPVFVDLEPGGAVGDIELRLRHGGSITGEVVDANGKGLSDREVSAWCSDNGSNADATTDAGGRFAFSNLLAGTYRVTAAPSSAEVIGLVGDGPGDFDDLLRREATVEVSEGGTIQVVLVPPPIQPIRLSGKVTLGGEAFAHAAFHASRSDGRGSSSETDEAGHYSLVLAGPGHHRISVGSPDGGLWSGRELDVPDGASATLDISIDVGTITGHVFGPGGSPLGGIGVRASDGPDPQSYGRNGARTTSDGSGAYTLRVPAGTYSVGAGGSDFGERLPSNLGRVVLPSISVPASGSVPRIDFHLEEGGTLEGTVRLADGSLPATTWVWSSSSTGERVGRGSADKAGAFRFENLAPGTLELWANDGAHVTEGWIPVEVRAGETTRIELVLVPGTTIYARVLDGLDAAVEAESVELLARDGRSLATGVLQEDGRTWLGMHPAGTYTVRTTAGGRTSEQRVDTRGQTELTVDARVE